MENEKIQPTITIHSDKSETIQRLKNNLEVMNATRQVMKKAYAVIRRHKGDKPVIISLLSGIKHISIDMAAKIVTPDNFGQIGFEASILKCLNTTSKRLEKRINKLQKLQNYELTSTR